MYRRQLTILPAALLAAAWLPSRASAADPATAGAFIQQLGRELPGVVGNATTDEEKRRRLQPFLARVVDVNAVARFCLGRYWRLATPAQQEEYSQIFLRVLVAAVAGRVGVYGAGTSQVMVLPEQPKADGVYVPTVVQTGTDPAVHVTWVVDTQARPFRILDVQAEGMSMRLSQRSDYTAFLDRNGGNIDALLRALRERTP